MFRVFFFGGLLLGLLCAGTVYGEGEKEELKTEAKEEKKDEVKETSKEMDHEKTDKMAKKGEKHKLHKGHSHGEAQLSVSAEESGVVKVYFDVPLESVVGFEHEPKTAEEKKALEDAKGLFVVSKLFDFDSKLGCTEVSSEVKFVYDEGHAEGKFKAEFKCTQLGSDNKVTFKAQMLPKVKKVHLKLMPAKGNATKATHKTFPLEFKL